VAIDVKVRWLGLLALVGIAGCERCGASSAASTTGAAPEASAEVASATATATASAAPAAGAPLPELVEVRDTGNGRATAALRAALSAYGLPFDPATLERDCKVDDDGASIDDLEDAAEKYGLDATQLIVPREHVLMADAKLLPAILILDGAEESREFVLAWRIDGDRVEIMSPVDGRKWVDRAEVQRGLYLHEMPVAPEDWQETSASPELRDALRVRMVTLGVERAAAQALLDKAAADATWRGLGALDAAIRQLEADPSKAAGDPRARLAAASECAFEKRESCGLDPIPAALWSVQPAPRAPEGEQVLVRGAVMLAIAGRRSP
jgi:ATP-binding cassette subfamily B protein